MSKKKNERVIITTCLEKDKKNDYKEVWDKIIKDTIEKKHGKIK